MLLMSEPNIPFSVWLYIKQKLLEIKLLLDALVGNVRFDYRVGPVTTKKEKEK